MYRLHPRTGVIHIATGVHVVPPGAEWSAYRAWLKAGGVPEHAEDEVEPIERVHERLISRINQRRNVVEQTVFTYMGRLLDSDHVSSIRIMGAAQAAQLAIATGSPFELEWTCNDNSVLAMTAEQVAAMPAALAMHSNAVHQAAKAMKLAADALLDAGDSAGLEWFDVDAGWP